jgi:hypothetical protein
MSGSNWTKVNEIIATVGDMAISTVKRYCGCLARLRIPEQVRQFWKGHRKNPKFSCVTIATNRLSQCYSTEIKYHHRIRYAYFELDASLRHHVTDGQEILFRIVNTSTNQDITRFRLDFAQLTSNDNIINNEQVHEFYQEGNLGSVIVRVPIHRPDGLQLVYIYSRSDGLDA